MQRAPILRHIAIYGFAATAVWWGAGRLYPAFWLYPGIGWLGLSCVLALTLPRLLHYQRIAALSLSLIIPAAVIILGVFQRTPPVQVSERVVLAIVLAQSAGAWKRRHYGLMGAAGLLLLLANLRQAGTIPLAVLLPTIIFGAASLADRGPDPDDSGAESRAVRLTAIPLHAFLLRVVLMATIAFYGGQYLSTALPIPVPEEFGSERRHWLSFARHILNRGEETPTRNRTRGSIPPDPGESAERHYAGRAIMDLTRTDPSGLSRQLLMTVESQRPFYLRGIAFDEYTGNRWKLSGEPEFRRASNPKFVRTMVRISEVSTSHTKTPQDISLRIQADLGRVIYVPTRATTLQTDHLPLVLKDQLENLYSPIRIKKGIRYRCYIAEPQQRNRTEYPLDDDEKGNPPHQKYLELPALPDRLIQRCMRAVEDAEDQWRAVQKLMQLVQEGKGYTTAARDIPDDEDAVDYFLFEMQDGSCSHYASALAVACRIVGIPARVATGFGPGSYDADAMRWLVREEDSHAWTQVWAPDHGWIDVDPTPGRYSDADNGEEAQRWTVKDAYEMARERIMALWADFRGLMSDLPQKMRNNSRWIVYTVIGLPLLIPLALAGLWSTRRIRWWIRWVTAPWLSPDRAAEITYRCVLEWLHRKVGGITPTMTPTEVVETAKNRDLPWAELLEELTDLAERLVFGPDSPDRESVRELRQKARDLKEHIRNR